MNQQELSALLTELRSHSHESEWIEFKHNNADPQEVGEYLSALSNSATLHRKDAAYIVWGIEDETHHVVGTTFKPRQAKKGNEELENWLLRLLSPRIEVKIHEFQENGLDVVIFESQPAHRTPVAFSGTEFIRVGSVKRKLCDGHVMDGAIRGWLGLAGKPQLVVFQGVMVSSSNGLLCDGHVIERGKTGLGNEGEVTCTGTSFRSAASGSVVSRSIGAR